MVKKSEGRRNAMVPPYIITPRKKGPGFLTFYKGVPHAVMVSQRKQQQQQPGTASQPGGWRCFAQQHNKKKNRNKTATMKKTT